MRWNTILENYQETLKFYQRRYVIENISSIVKEICHIDYRDDNFWKELNFWEMLPNIDELIFRETTIKVADNLGNGNNFIILQHLQGIIELIPHLKKLDKLSSENVYTSIYDLRIDVTKDKQLYINCINEKPNQYGLCIVVNNVELPVENYALDKLMEVIELHIR